MVWIGSARSMHLCLLLVFAVSLSWIPPMPVFADDQQSAYEALEEYGFPVGILPKGVTGYKLNQTTGKFAAYLNGSCSFSLEGSYQLRYKSTITGVISKKKISSLSGITVKVLFFWLDIVEVVRDGDKLQFSVGVASASFSLDNFEESPQCGCGFDCVNAPRSLSGAGRPLFSSS